MAWSSLFKVSQYNRNQFVTRIIDASAPRVDYYFLVVLSTLIVALGLLAENVILIIGGMLVTPLLSPILALALGLVINEHKVIIRSLRILITSLLFAFVVALFTGLFSPVSVKYLEVITIMEPSLFTLLIAIIAGLAASFTWVKPGLNDTLPGIAVTVTLIPPLTAIGLTISHGEWALLRNVMGVFLLNLLGIILASIVVFSLMEFYKAKRKAVEEVKEEEKEIEKAKAQKEKGENNQKNNKANTLIK
jgi:uncharacterized hydrophobic protein (TIGR00271 family)